jgi:hypothetical protein
MRLSIMKGLHQRVGVCILTRMAHINLLVYYIQYILIVIIRAQRIHTTIKMIKANRFLWLWKFNTNANTYMFRIYHNTYWHELHASIAKAQTILLYTLSSTMTLPGVPYNTEYFPSSNAFAYSSPQFNLL